MTYPLSSSRILRRAIQLLLWLLLPFALACQAAPLDLNGGWYEVASGRHIYTDQYDPEEGGLTTVDARTGQNFCVHFVSLPVREGKRRAACESREFRDAKVL